MSLEELRQPLGYCGVTVSLRHLVSSIKQAVLRTVFIDILNCLTDFRGLRTFAISLPYRRRKVASSTSIPHLQVYTK